MFQPPNRFRAGRAVTAVMLAALLVERARTRAAFARRESAVAATAQEHAALHAVAALVARGAELDELCARVAEAAAGLLGGEVATVLRFDEARRAMLVGRWVGRIEHYPQLGEEFKFTPTSAIGTLLAERRTVRVASGTPSTFQRVLGERVATPIELDGRLWGALAVGGVVGESLPSDAEERIKRFAELVAIAIANAEARAQLVARATTDPLTGVANHRAFHERLHAEVARARRYERPLSLVVFDIDRFKLINDTAGHLAGDAVLTEVARRLVTATRSDAIVGRLGGDEFAAVLPECDAATALRVAERARGAVGAWPIGAQQRVTLSAGVSEMGVAHSAEALLECADDALYRVKAQGRNACLLYSARLSVSSS
jgi:diguanylate cyclase (GGDEF)-like protein